MNINLNPLSPVIELGTTIIDKIFPDKDEAQKAKLAILELQQKGELTELNQKYNAIVAEAKSNDPWTSRARPAFLYVIYILLLSAIPFGILYAFNPVVANNITTGIGAWFKAIPDSIYTLFGAGYLGYGGYRSYDKGKILSAKKNK